MTVLLVLALVTPIFSPFFRRIKVEKGSTENLPPVSIVIVEHDSAFRLEKVLPHYLSQQYAEDYQVVVVIDEGDSESEDILKRKGEDPHLYYIKLPDSSRYISRKKLGITLGMKAAKYDWVIVTDVHCYPEHEGWLTAMASHCQAEGTKMVLGLTPYAADAPRCFRFEQLRTMLYCMREAKRDNAFATNQSMVMMRKSDFFKHRGFEGNLEYARAEFEFLVNKFGDIGRVALALEPEARLTQFSPKPSRRRGRLLYVMNAMKDLDGTSTYTMHYRLDLIMMHIFNWLTFGLILIGALDLYDSSQSAGPVPSDLLYIDAIYVILPIVFWLISFVVRCIIYRPMLSYFSDINPVSAVMMEWGITFRDLGLYIRYIFTNKTDFITHKL